MTTTIRTDLLSPEQVTQLVPGTTKNYLAQLRHLGRGPTYLKPSPRKVLYRRDDVMAWIDASERSGTAEGA